MVSRRVCQLPSEAEHCTQRASVRSAEKVTLRPAQAGQDRIGGEEVVAGAGFCMLSSCKGNVAGVFQPTRPPRLRPLRVLYWQELGRPTWAGLAVHRSRVIRCANSPRRAEPKSNMG